MERPPHPQAPVGPTSVPIVWRRNQSLGAARRGALVSLGISLGLLALSSASLLAGDYTVFTLLVVFIAFYFVDTALTRMAAVARAPREVGLSASGLHLRTPRGEVFVAWDLIREVRQAAIGGRSDLLRLEMYEGEPKVFRGMPAALSMEVKLAWLEAAALQKRPRARVIGVTQGAAVEAPEPLGDLELSTTPQYWTPGEVRPATPQELSRKAPSSVSRAGSDPEAARPPTARPPWSYTRGGSGAAVADPRYPAQPASIPSFTWHFIPPTGTRVGGVFLVAVLILAGIAISRLAADVTLSLAGFDSDPWVATAIGLGLGLVLAAAVWTMARDELAGEVAGSVLFVPTFDRTKAELSAALREAGASLGAGRARERRRRGRVVLVWPEARTRATLLQASYETRALLLKTVGQSNYGLHTEFKGAILERLRPQARRK